jgi:predicted enzyme related to lactoylglutathione lyase
MLKGGIMSDHAVVHIEIPAKDPKAAGAFYEKLFGWNITEDENMNYCMFQPENGPGGGFPVLDDTFQPGDITLYISCDDVDEMLAKAEGLGAKVLVPKTEIPQTGWFAFFEDPTGNRMGVYASMSQPS